MDRIVKLMEDEAAKAVHWLRASALGDCGVGRGAAGGPRLVCRAAGDANHSLCRSTNWNRAWPNERRSWRRRSTSLRREVHEREDAELKNQRLSAQLAHAERITTMGHLTAGLAHELNQPLAAITNYADACDVLLDEAAANRASWRGCMNWSSRRSGPRCARGRSCGGCGISCGPTPRFRRMSPSTPWLRKSSSSAAPRRPAQVRRSCSNCRRRTMSSSPIRFRFSRCW